MFLRDSLDIIMTMNDQVVQFFQKALTDVFLQMYHITLFIEKHVITKFRD